MRRDLRLLVALSLVAAALPAPGAEDRIRDATEEEIDVFVEFMREHFDDIHDVSMRFHAVDPTIGGLIVLDMVWDNGRMVAASVTTNETGNDEEPLALLETLRTWQIGGLEGPCHLEMPFRIKLVGSDDPAFPDRAILTGSVRTPGGDPIAGATIRFTAEAGGPPSPNPARTNREGIFVRTLIPPGTWTLTCEAEGFRTTEVRDQELEAGAHVIRHFMLRPGEG